MTEPRPDGVDIDTGTEQVCRGGVTDGVWADSLCRQGRSFTLGPQRVTFNQSVNAEAGNRMVAAIEKDMLVGWTVGDQSGEFSNGRWPKRTKTLLAAFAMDLHRRRAQVQIGDQQLRRFIGAAAGVVKKQKKGIIAAALGSFGD